MRHIQINETQTTTGANEMTLFSKEHYDLIEMFEKEFSGRKDKEPKDLWSKGVVYQDGMVNMLFLAYRKGFALGKTS